MRTHVRPRRSQVPSPNAGMRAPLASMIGADMPTLTACRSPSRLCRRRSRRLLVDLAADQHAADLARAGTDLVELGITQQPPGWKIVDVAVAAETLDGFERHPGGAFGRVEDRSGRVLARDAAIVAAACDRVDVGPGRVHGHVHVGDLSLHELELTDWLTELFAVVHVRKHDVHAGLHD